MEESLIPLMADTHAWLSHFQDVGADYHIYSIISTLLMYLSIRGNIWTKEHVCSSNDSLY